MRTPRVADDLGFCIVVRKASTDTRIVFAVLPTAREADNLAARLKQLGLDAAIERVRDQSVSPGQTIRQRRR